MNLYGPSAGRTDASDCDVELASLCVRSEPRVAAKETSKLEALLRSACEAMRVSTFDCITVSLGRQQALANATICALVAQLSIEYGLSLELEAGSSAVRVPRAAKEAHS